MERVGPALDARVDTTVFKRTRTQVPAYSTNEAASEAIKTELSKRFEIQEFYDEPSSRWLMVVDGEWGGWASTIAAARCYASLIAEMANKHREVIR